MTVREIYSKLDSAVSPRVLPTGHNARCREWHISTLSNIILLRRDEKASILYADVGRPVCVIGHLAIAPVAYPKFAAVTEVVVPLCLIRGPILVELVRENKERRVRFV